MVFDYFLYILLQTDFQLFDPLGSSFFPRYGNVRDSLLAVSLLGRAMMLCIFWVDGHNYYISSTCVAIDSCPVLLLFLLSHT